MTTPFEIILLQNPQHPEHIHVTVVNERLLVKRHFAADVAQVDISQFVLAAVGFNRFVNVALGHFGEGAHAKFERIGRAGFKSISRW